MEGNLRNVHTGRRGDNAFKIGYSLGQQAEKNINSYLN